MLIGICGAPSCGKTVLSRALVNELCMQGHNAEYINEYARYYINRCKLFDSPFIKTPLHQVNILRGQMDWENAVPPEVQFKITDSPILAHPVYTFNLVDFDDFSHSEYYHQYYRDMLEHRDRYFPLIYLPCNIDFKTDGTRMQNEDRARQLGEQIKAFLVFHRIPFYEIVETDLQARVQTCLKIILNQ